MKLLGLALAATALAAAPAGPTVQVGDLAPEIGGEWYLTKASSLADVRGRVVLVDFWRTWWGPCNKGIPELNELQQELGPKGFTVVGVSNEGSGLIERHIEKMNIQYPIASVKGSDADTLYGVKGFPSGALINAAGEVIWMGHPGSVPRDLIERELEHTAFLPGIEGKAYKKLDKLIAEKQYGKAHAAIVKALEKEDDPVLAEARANLEALLERKTAQAAAAEGAGDYARAHAIYSELADLYKGHAAEDAAEEAAEAIEKNPDAKDELDAWEKMAKGDEAQRAGDFEKAAKVYEGIVKSYPETKCAERAEAFLARHPL